MTSQQMCILAFDHRATFRRRVAEPAPVLQGAPGDLVSGCKEIIYEAYDIALASGAVDPSVGAIIVDEERAADLARRAELAGHRFGMPVEKTEQAIFAFEYGPDWQTHIAAFDASFYKGLARWNPEDAAINAQQVDQLANLSRWLRETGRGFLLELLVQPTAAQLELLGGDAAAFDLDHRPKLMVQAMEQLHEAEITPDIWKIEGVSRRHECVEIGMAARAHPAKPDAVCVVLGRAADEPQIQHWLATSAGVVGYAGFALGRNLFWDPLGDWLGGLIEADEAAQRIADSYSWYVEFYNRAAG